MFSLLHIVLPWGWLKILLLFKIKGMALNTAIGIVPFFHFPNCDTDYYAVCLVRRGSSCSGELKGWGSSVIESTYGLAISSLSNCIISFPLRSFCVFWLNFSY